MSGENTETEAEQSQTDNSESEQSHLYVRGEGPAVETAQVGSSEESVAKNKVQIELDEPVTPLGVLEAVLDGNKSTNWEYNARRMINYVLPEQVEVPPGYAVEWELEVQGDLEAFEALAEVMSEHRNKVPKYSNHPTSTLRNRQIFGTGVEVMCANRQIQEDGEVDVGPVKNLQSAVMGGDEDE